MPDHLIYPSLFAIFAFILGASIGSFLNVCIYRMPRGLSVNQPKRSFCPTCKYQIPWSSNLPLITWTFQKGKCRNCGSPISVRYFLVELLTGLLFLGVWLKVSTGPWLRDPSHWVLFFPLAVFTSMLIVATFIDFEFFEIPDEITIGGTIAGIAFSAGLPQMHGEMWGTWMGHLYAAGWSALGAVSGFALLWLVSALGKLAFGKKTEVFKEAIPFKWIRKGEEAHLEIGKEKREWVELFTSEKDTLLMECATLEIEGISKTDYALNSKYETLEIDGKTIKLDEVDTFSGTLRKLSWKRDAMGFGDVKFIACIGAFLGWQAVLFTVMAASVLGAVIGGIPLLIGKREWAAKIPFGPYLSLGALLWIFYGPELVGWYLSFNPPPGASDLDMPPIE